MAFGCVCLFVGLVTCGNRTGVLSQRAKFYDEKSVYPLKIKKRIAIYSYIRPNSKPA
jgi:hypothetical protein